MSRSGLCCWERAQVGMWEWLEYLVLLKSCILGTAGVCPFPYAVNTALKGSFSGPSIPSWQSLTSHPAQHQNPAWELVAGKGPPGIPRAQGPGVRGLGRVRSLTIMFSSAYLASQQLRNTGMNKFRKGGQNIYKSKSYS